ncbi:uncharacterized protein LOC110837678 isoform X2 [Zootermopsis nevadensis]|uniref:uncharacterized protein LOC110837678 isoform X2 n=1 Tax=Zootermopsis nevadensis TaxID=136037 RepID=UPI000B8E8C27|nr:uncharacterized protein LOC110837678 isoform X2 [Zootermopsis nevadensis]
MNSAVVFGVLVASLAVHSEGGPVNIRAWHHPCGHSVRADTNTGKHASRHGPSKLLKVVKTQIGVANKYFKNEEKNIVTTYKQVGLLKEELYRYDWLPQRQLNWYKNKIQCLEKSAKVKNVLQVLHSSLQNFSATFEELRKFNRPEIYPENIARIRKGVIKGIAQHLTQVLCEVEWALESLNISIPDRVREDFFSTEDKWDRSPDATGSLVQDWGVISLYKKFLGEWNLIIGKVMKKGVCKNSESVGKRKKKQRQ